MIVQNKREWMGIEPTRSRVSDPSTALKAAGPTRRPDTPEHGISSAQGELDNTYRTANLRFFADAVPRGRSKRHAVGPAHAGVGARTASGFRSITSSIK